jgi:hypothetical protein
MRTHALFVPHGGHHLATAVTAPDAPARGLAVFPLRALPLVTAGFVFWARAAAALADRSIASVRFERPGSGDSTGTLTGDLTDVADAVAETLAVAELALRAFGVDRFAVAGSCGAGLVALGAGADPRCAAVVGIDLRNVDPGSRGRVRRVAAGSALAGLIRGHPRVRRAVLFDRVRNALPDRMPASVPSLVAVAARTSRVLLVPDANDDTLGLDELTGLCEVRRDIDFGTLRIDAVELPPGEELVLEALVDWIDASFPAAVSPDTAPAALGG